MAMGPLRDDGPGSEMNIRVKGLLQFLGSGLVFGVVIGWFMQQRAIDPTFKLPGGIFSLLLMMAPGGFALAGLLQLLTGVPFSELSDRWNALKGWQRGVIGVFSFLLGLALLFGGLVGYGYLTNGG